MAACAVAAGAVVEVLAAAVGARIGGLQGLSIGWVVATSIEAAFMAPTVWRAAMAGTADER
jgi:hypothetical protein